MYRTGALMRASTIAEYLRREPYHLLCNNCIRKSLRLRKLCRAEGINAAVLICIGRTRCTWFGRKITIPVVHAWGIVEGIRLETAHPAGTAALWGIRPDEVVPVLALQIGGGQADSPSSSS